MNTAEEQSALDSIVAGVLQRVHAALPRTAQCIDLFEQWRDGLAFALHHPDKDECVMYVNSLLRSLLDAMKEQGVTTI